MIFYKKNWFCNLFGIKHPAVSGKVLNALFQLLIFNQLTPQGARN